MPTMPGRSAFTSIVRLACASLATLCAAASLWAADAQPPERLVVDGAGTLSRAGYARRSHLLDTMPLYVLALYADGPAERARLGSAAVAKALRIDVMYADDLRRRIPFDWRRELVPPLEPPAAAHLSGAFAPVRSGDVIVIEYVPEDGTTVRVNKGVAVSRADHDLMLAFLDHWLGQRPVSEELKRALLAAS
jgi:hypothetical protein